MNKRASLWSFPSPISTGIPGTVTGPRYDRASVEPGHPSHRRRQLPTLHQTVYQWTGSFGRALDLDWAIVGAGIKPFDAERRRLLAAQAADNQWLNLGPDESSARVIGAMVGLLRGPTEQIVAACRPRSASVSLTITEGGYYTDAATAAV